ncbi:MAG: pyridoxamine 5'-phosphate oxidase [Bacteriovoracaceae bacterium]|nr:pyridoxamine 5'-phosphate oxidase [Bacteriovoracaceae bacterium]
MNPYERFQQLYDHASVGIDREVASTMCLSTVDGEGKPHSRMVLFKGLFEGKFSFFTNYQSHKGEEIEANPNVALLFHWTNTKCQVRIEGRAVKAPRDFVENYWNTRPLESQISGAISDQSRSIDLYQNLVKKFEVMRASATKIMCPENWGGYLVEPEYFEFWEASPFRLHKRRVMKKTNTGWDSQFLAP